MLKTDPQTTSAWLLESENGLYIGENKMLGKLGFISGHESAIRLSRKEDAEALRRCLQRYGVVFHEDAKGATEHEWEG